MVMSDEDPAFLTTTEFARRTRLSRATVRRMCVSGAIAHVVISPRGDRRIPSSEVDRLRLEAEANRKEGTPHDDASF
jgi:excisionase family DNA binding protein